MTIFLPSLTKKLFHDLKPASKPFENPININQTNSFHHIESKGNTPRKMVAVNNSNSKVGVDKTRGLKKGPWTTAEDAILMEYVKKHGEGNWNAVQRNCGLLRCGKSCRLRWANHLRPNLKKGSFTPDEERLIIELHAKIGNKWARMASQLPGRTDNEIKNYWNTRVKRLQRAGLPIYPDDVPYNYQNNRAFQQTNPNSPITPPSHSSQFNTSISLLNPILHFPGMVNPPFGFTGHLPMSSINSLSPFTSPPSNLYGQSFRMSSPFSPFGLFTSPRKVELSSIQTWMTNMGPSTPALSTTSGSGGNNVIRAKEEGYFKNDALEEGNNSGLLEVLLEESNTLVKSQSMKRTNSFCDGNGKEVSEEDSNGGTKESPFHSSCGMKEDPMEEMNQLDDDLSSLLNNFPLSSPVPDWYEETATIDVDTHEDQSSGLVIETTTPTNPKWSMGSSCWNNMPSIC